MQSEFVVHFPHAPIIEPVRKQKGLPVVGHASLVPEPSLEGDDAPSEGNCCSLLQRSRSASGACRHWESRPTIWYLPSAVFRATSAVWSHPSLVIGGSLGE